MAITVVKNKHPEKTKLSAAVVEDKDAIKARKGIIDKHATLIKTTKDADDLVEATGSTMCPTSDQLNRINKFTRKAVTSEEVVCFKTLSCNDIPDRDDDRFTTQCVKDFSELEQPFSPTGKSFMLDHEYKIANAVGRIFGTDTEKIEGALFLTNEVYIPNTAQFQPLIEKIDFGINWAVSVGVMLGADECSLGFCKAPFSSWGWWCQNGHDKGAYYTEDGEEDEWGWPIACDPETNGAQKCIRNFFDPRDMYELSQVFLGAQYFAALEKQPAFASVMKSAASKGVPIIGLSEEEGKELPLHREPRRVTEARMRFGVTEHEDGTLQWVDEQKLIWSFDPVTEEFGSLGRAASTDTNNESEEADGEGQGLDEHDAGDEGSGNEQASVNAGESEGGEVDSSAEGSTESLGGESGEVTTSAEGGEDGEEESTTTTEEEEEVSESSDSNTDQSLVDLATSAGLPETVIAAVKKATGKKALPVVFAAFSNHIKAIEAEKVLLAEKAAIGESVLVELRAEAIDWYVKAHKTADTVPVKTETFEKILKRCDDDVELIRGLVEENKELARAKFPKTVRRSSVPVDPNERKGAPDVDWDSENDERVSRLHS